MSNARAILRLTHVYCKLASSRINYAFNEFGIARRISVFRNPDAKGDQFLFGLLTATFEGAPRSVGARTGFPGATPSTARAFATTGTPFTITY